jgi:hypothetical protein
VFAKNRGKNGAVSTMEQEFWEDSEILGKRQERTQKIYIPITMGEGGGLFFTDCI